MNRKQKIIISITGIFLVMLILSGLTYAYYLTRITGNTKDKSISIETANLRIEYSESDNTIIDNDGEPFKPIKKEDKSDANKLGEKVFEIQNIGDTSVFYAIVIEDVIITDTITGEKTTFESNDFVYELICTEYYSNDVPMLIEDRGIFPLNDTILREQVVAPGEANTCTLSVWYLDNGKDQSNDMHKNITARINIVDPREYNPYEDKENSLAYNIVNNAINVTNDEINKNYAAYRRTPLTEPAKELSLEMESSLSQAPDDYTELTGFNSFYFRGNVKNNYVTFNNMCWRIVRIEGDGSVKLILADKDAGCSEETLNKTDSAFIGTGDYGYYDNSHSADYENVYNINPETSINYKFNEWLNGTLEDGTTPRFSDSNKEQIISKKICLGDMITTYDPDGNIIEPDIDLWYYKNGVRLFTYKRAQLTCDINGYTKNDYKLYPITADEAIFAGGVVDEPNQNYYLMKNAISDDYWTTSSIAVRMGFIGDEVFQLNSVNGTITDIRVDNETSLFRPSISLIPGIEIETGGIGTVDKPYVIKTN